MNEGESFPLVNPMASEGSNLPSENPPSYTDACMASSQGQYHSINQPPNVVCRLPPAYEERQTIPTFPASSFYIPGSDESNAGSSVNLNIPSTVGQKSMLMRCFHCHSYIETKTLTSFKAIAHLACVLLFLLTCGIFSCIPFCIAPCKRVDHLCPNCGTLLASYNA